jgi:integrase/recombinase XerD
MIERFFRKAHVRRRLQEGPLASVVRDYLGRLEERGYGRRTIHQYVQASEHFGRWLMRSGRTLARADATVVEEFLTRHLPRCQCPTPRSRTRHGVRAALRQLLAAIGVDQRPLPQASTRDAIDTVVDDFERHLTDTCGAAAATRRYYLREVRAFLGKQFSDGPVDLASVTAATAREFVTMRGKTLSPASTNVVVTAVRSFGRYLQLRGITVAWTAAVPRAADWRLARVPRVLTDDEVDALLASFDRTRPQGRRDYAIAQCLLGLGLRASEVAGLRLADVDWRAGIITQHAGKTRRGSSLPLPASVARALSDYLRYGRPRTSDRALFVHHRPPRGRRIGPAVVRSAMRLAYARAGLDPELTGTHVLRHTAATRLLRAGVSMKEIADVLGHRSLDTSAIYAKVDLPALAAVALPWPGVQP